MRGVPTDIQKKLLLSVGSHQATRPLSPVEVAQAVQASLNAGSTLQEIAEFLHLETTTELSKFVRLLRLSPAVRHLVDWGRPKSAIGFSVASEVARLDDPNEQMELCQAALKHQIGRSEMQQILQLRKRSGKPIEDCVAEIMQLRPRIQRIHVFVGAVTADNVSQRLSQMSQTERDRVLQAAVKRAFPTMERFGARLGPERFTITGDDGVSAELLQGGRDFESIINKELVDALSS